MTSASINIPPPVAPATLSPVPAPGGPGAALVPGFAAMLLPVATDVATGAQVAGTPPAAEEGGTVPPPDGNLVPLASPWLPPVATVQPLPPGPPAVLAGRPAGTKHEPPGAPATSPSALADVADLSALTAEGDGTAQPVPGAAPSATATAVAGTARAALLPPAVGLEDTQHANTAAPGPGLPPTAARADLTESATDPRLARFQTAQGGGAGAGQERDAEAVSAPLTSRDAAAESTLVSLVTAEGELPANAAGSPSNAALAPAPPTRTATPTAVMQLATPVGAEPFGQELGERVAWMVGRDLTTAQLKLNPPQLGPVEVRVQVNGDQASVSLSAHNFVARDALEQAIPRLRDMLGAQGFTQVDVNVAQHSFHERPAQPDRYDRDDAALAEAVVELPAAGTVRSTRAAMTLVDTYA